jgi:hypothetical protein
MIRDYRRYNCSQNGIVRKLDRMYAVFRNRNVVYETHVEKSRMMLIKAEDNFLISCEVLKNDPGYILEGETPVFQR